jgi:hypothetical protein
MWAIWVAWCTVWMQRRAGVWTEDTMAPIWGCLLVANDRLYAGTDGVLTGVANGRRKQLARIEMDAPLLFTPGGSRGLDVSGRSPALPDQRKAQFAEIAIVPSPFFEPQNVE